MSTAFYIGAGVVLLVVFVSTWSMIPLPWWAKILGWALLLVAFYFLWPFLVIGYVVLLLTMRVSTGRAEFRREG